MRSLNGTLLRQAEAFNYFLTFISISYLSYGTDDHLTDLFGRQEDNLWRHEDIIELYISFRMGSWAVIKAASDTGIGDGLNVSRMLTLVGSIERVLILCPVLSSSFRTI
jgi:hypothetical protein